ncbi:hypothetical protein V9T40_002728 [Parthenolecanium corni]|uniref:Uncharacterized protein n=1 Tax=Parthenolecanium corni TaxID=536013 RepID=A0AAN9TJE0_9HEMI
MYFLFCLFAKSLLAASENTTTNQPWTSTERNNVSTKLVEETTSSQSNRRGYERNVLVVLPVMQGDSELSNSNLQMLYTKTPVTAIINDQPAIRSNGSGRRSTTARRPSTSTTPLTSTVSTAAAYSTSSSTKKILAQTTRAAAPNKRDDSRHPYTDFLSTKPAYQTHKSPLDYGYPETFKFVQELNELPKNHKPEWAQSELAEAETKKSTTTEGSTKGSPFQMFESVKPLEINKLLSLKPVAIPVTDSIFEETAVKNKQGTTEPSFRVTKRPFNKRPIKKPQKVKLSPQKLSDAELAPFIPFIVTSTDNMFNEISSQSTVKSTQTSTSSSSSSTTAALTSQTTQAMSSSTQMPVSEQSTSKSDVELYDAARYSALFAKSTKVFLPTPYISSSDRSVIRPIQSSTLGGPSSESWSPMTSPLTTTTARITTSTPTTTAATTSTSTTTSSPFSPNFNWANINTPVIPVMETNTPKTEPQVKPSDLISLTKILDEHFDKQSHGILQSTTAKPHFPADMLTNDMKNMLIALGLLKPEQDSSLPLLLITSTVAPSTIDPQYFNNLFIKKELVTPTIDPNSYLNFKKLPINYEKPQVSNDMRDLLSSFGLLPSAKSTHLGTNSILTRVSRQQKAETSDHSMDMLDDKMRETLENLGLMKQMALQMNRKGHVFQPSMHLEKLADPQQV